MGCITDGGIAIQTSLKGGFMSPERSLNLIITAIVAVILIVLLLMLLGVIASPF